jgi:hypothetical protein
MDNKESLPPSKGKKILVYGLAVIIGLIVLTAFLPSVPSSGWDVFVDSEGGKDWVFWIYDESGSLIDETPLNGVLGTGRGELHLPEDYKALSLHMRSKSLGGDYVNVTIKENGIVVANNREYVLSKDDAGYTEDFRLTSPGYEKALDDYIAKN